MMNEKKRSRQSLLIILTIIVLSVVGSISIIAHELQRPVTVDVKRSSQIARKHAKLTHINEVQRFTHGTLEYTVVGSTKDHQYVFAVVQDSGKQVDIFKQSTGISQSKAEKTVRGAYSAKKITSSSFGVINKQPVWDISFIDQKKQLNIVTLDFKKGNVIKHVKSY
ncbi:hypothetical protein LSA03_01190 [Pediococcus argentinicus]|nr:hypothetical protein LSA03_01190 [Pediococcus argentinicus]